MESKRYFQYNSMKNKALENNQFSEIDSSEAIEMLNNPNYVVKKLSFESLEAQYQGKIDGEFKSEELIRIAKNLFKELDLKYDIEVPVEFFVSKEGGSQMLYTRVDKINEQDLGKKGNLKDVNEIVKNLFLNLSKYYLCKFSEEGFFLTDINSASQYVYGNDLIKGEKEKKLYMVDADTYLDNKKKSLLTVVYWLSRYLSGVEYKLEENNFLARNNIKEFIEKYQKRFLDLEFKDKKRLLEIKNFLSGKRFGEEILPAIPTFEKD